MNAERSERAFFLAVLGPFVLSIAALAVVVVVGFSVLSAARAFVAGESQWSKGRSAAVAALRAYANRGLDADYHRFEAALVVPLGDRRARLALDRPDPDLAAAREGFLAGDNAAEDIDGMIRLFRYGRHLDVMREAIDAWTEGDALVAELRELGQALRRQHFATVPDHVGMEALAARIDDLDRALVSAERRFTMALGRASVVTERLLVGLTIALASLLALLAVLSVRRVLRAQLERRRLIDAANRRWALAADAAGLGLFEWRRSDDCFHLDGRAAAIHGLDARLPVRRGALGGAIHPDDRAQVQGAWERAIERAELFHQRYRIERADAAERWVEATGLAHDEAGVVIGVVRDITDEAVLGRLTLEKQAAERVAQARVDFLSRLSHELRTPLNAVLGLAQLLRIDAGEPLSAAQDRRVRIIIDSGQQLLRLVEDVLDITRIDSGTVALKLQSTDVDAALRAALNLVEPERAAVGVTIDAGLALGVPRVASDPQRLQQVFVNLLSNGCKYNRRGGRLTVVARGDGPWLHLDFTDEGPGLEPAQLRELFQPFKRLAPTAEAGGTGLGLVVVKLLVEQMHGRVEVRSTPGQGACFTVSLPRA